MSSAYSVAKGSASMYVQLRGCMLRLKVCTSTAYMVKTGSVSMYAVDVQRREEVKK